MQSSAKRKRYYLSSVVFRKVLQGSPVGLWAWGPLTLVLWPEWQEWQEWQDSLDTRCGIS